MAKAEAQEAGHDEEAEQQGILIPLFLNLLCEILASGLAPRDPFS